MKKRDINKKKKRSDLLSAAYDLFTTIGFSNTTISKIVEKANVGKGTFYLYFKDKEEIRNTLITEKSSEIFQDAMKKLNEYCYSSPDQISLCDKIIFITDYIITTLSRDIALLKYISKYLSWGMFSIPFIRSDEKNELLDFRAYATSMLKKEGVTLENVDLVIFTVIELINSTCYNVILNGEPVTFSDYKPYLFRCIRLIVNDAIK